jgi:hypothetical protein
VTQPIQPGGADEAAVVENLVQILVKAFSAILLYNPNNEIYLQALDSMRAALTLVWAQMDEVHFVVTETDLEWEEKKVLSQDDKSDSIPWTLFKDGVRAVTLTPGVEDREILAFLHVIKEARTLSPDDPDDLLTLLWEQDFQHVRYRFVELGYDDVPPIHPDTIASGPSEDRPSDDEARSRIAQETGPSEESPAGVVKVEDFDSTLYFLDDKEIDYLKGEIDREYQQNLRKNVLSVLFEVFELQETSTIRGEVLAIVDSFVPHLLAIGDLQSVALVVRKLRQMQEVPGELLAEQRQTMATIPVKISNPTALGQLIQSLDDAAVQPTQDEVSELFSELGPQVLDTILNWLPKLVNQRVQEVLRQVARGIAAEHPAQAVASLRTKDVVALLQTLQLLSTLKVERLGSEFGKLLLHADSEVRHEAVKALGAIGSATAMKQLEPAVEDEEREVRIAAVQFCVQHKYPGILSKVEAAINGKLLRGADLSEKKPYFEAYGMFVGNDGVSPLYEMLHGRGMFRRKDDPETRACAALALGKIGTPEARAALEASAGAKDPLIKNAISNALREIPNV